MTTQLQALIPNIGDVANVEVIEILVKEGDSIDVDTPLLTLETDKASMDVPSMLQGVVDRIEIKVGDKVSEGSVILTVKSEVSAEQKIHENTTEPKKEELSVSEQEAVANVQTTQTAPTQVDIVIPDIGDAKNIDVIDVMVQPGDHVSVDQSIITLEGDKATMDIPSTHAGVVDKVFVKVGDKVSKGVIVLSLVCQHQQSSTFTSENKAPTQIAETPMVKETKQSSSPISSTSSSIAITQASSASVYASPSVRRLAREFGVDLTLVEGSGRKSRIVKEDVQSFVKKRLAEPQANMGIPQIASIDFSKFGAVVTEPLNKIKRLTAQNMSRSWLNVPHVTHFDEADITDLEAFRQSMKNSPLAKQVKLTPLAFIVHAVAKTLQAFPTFNASLDPKGENLILKQYYNVGIAVDTPNGLVVPVIKDAHSKGLLALAEEMAELGQKARNKALKPDDMMGGSFTISSLGGIGGMAFTPIVNAPEVAILGVSKSQMKPVYNGKDFDARLMLPLSLSYDHRVIDGAEAARFSAYLCQCLSDIRTLLL